MSEISSRDSRTAFRDIVQRVAPGYIEQAVGAPAGDARTAETATSESDEYGDVGVVSEGLLPVDNEQVTRWPERDPYDAEAVATELLFGMFTLKHDADLKHVNVPQLVSRFLSVPQEAVDGLVYQMCQQGLLEAVLVDDDSEPIFALVADHPGMPTAARADEIVVGEGVLTREAYTEVVMNTQAFMDNYRRLGGEAAALEAATERLSQAIGEGLSGDEGMFQE